MFTLIVFGKFCAIKARFGTDLKKLAENAEANSKFVKEAKDR